MTSYKVFIPGWRPAYLNELLCHWAKSARRKKHDKEMIWAYCQQIPKAKGKRRIEMTIRLTGRQKPCDPDAPYKSLLDALVQNKLLVDDSAKWVESMPTRFIRDIKGGTELILSELA